MCIGRALQATNDVFPAGFSALEVGAERVVVSERECEAACRIITASVCPCVRAAALACMGLSAGLGCIMYIPGPAGG